MTLASKTQRGIALPSDNTAPYSIHTGKKTKIYIILMLFREIMILKFDSTL